MLEVGKERTFEQIQSLIQRNDTDVTLKMGLVISAKQGSLLVLREAIEHYLSECGGALIFHQFTAQPLYIVHYKDLSPQKQQVVGYKARE